MQIDATAVAYFDELPAPLRGGDAQVLVPSAEDGQDRNIEAVQSLRTDLWVGVLESVAVVVDCGGQGCYTDKQSQK